MVSFLFDLLFIFQLKEKLLLTLILYVTPVTVVPPLSLAQAKLCCMFYSHPLFNTPQKQE